MSTLIEGGLVFDVLRQKTLKSTDVFCDKGRIVEIGTELKKRYPAATVIKAQDLWVLPGCVDTQAHLKDPGYEEEESLFSGARAAAAGGFTTVACMPNTRPVLDNGALIDYIKYKGKEADVHICPVGAATREQKGQELTEMADLVQRGAVAVTDNGHAIMNSDVMRRVMEYAKMLNVPFLAFCEDESLSAYGLMNEGYWSTVLGLPGIPKQAEYTLVARNIALAELTGCALHIQNVSCKESVDLIKAAQKKGLRVSAETAVAYFLLNEEAVQSYHPHLKLRPPLRSAKDQKAIVKALKDGVISVICSAHQPKRTELCEVEFGLAPWGAIGLETTLSLSLNHLAQGKASQALPVVSQLTINPARVLGLEQVGALEVGYNADVVLFDPKCNWTINKENLKSKSQNSPWLGQSLTGRVIRTLVQGKTVHHV